MTQSQWAFADSSAWQPVASLRYLRYFEALIVTRYLRLPCLYSRKDANMQLLGLSKRKEWLDELEQVCSELKLVKFKGCSSIEEAEAFYEMNKVDSLVVLCESFDIRSFVWLERLCSIKDNVPVIMITDAVNNEMYLGAVEIRVADIIVGDYDAQTLDASLDKVVYGSRRTTYSLVHKYINDSKNAVHIGTIAV